MASASPSAAPFSNEYYKRTVASEKTCDMCYKGTVCCLATADVSDFLYCCPSHLTDRGFCSKLETPQPSSSSLHTPSQADIDSVTREWKDKQAKKKEDAEKSTREDSEKSEEKGSKKSPSVKAPTPSNNPGSGTASPRTASQLEKYALHKDIFRMRIEAWNRKRARSRAAQLPSIPRG